MVADNVLFACVIALAALLVGCAKPLPPDKQSYAGDWRADNMSLLITASGEMKYERRNGSSSVSVEGPIQRFEGDSFLVGIGPLHTTFVVNAPPHQEDESWTMTVDGVQLTRSSDWHVE